MIVFDLKCASNHVFEAWFASNASFMDQQARGLLSCAICGTSDVEKAPMAANIPVKANRSADPAPQRVDNPAPVPSAADMKTFITKLAAAQNEMLKDSQWVGRDFDKQARAMDAGEMSHATIHGEVSPQEAKTLIEDGIGVLPLPLPVIPPEKRN